MMKSVNWHLVVSNHTCRTQDTLGQGVNILSHPAEFQFGVPKGSVLGPVHIVLYTNPISSSIQSYSSIKYYFFADIYLTLSPVNFSHSIQTLRNCLNDIQFILIGPKNICFFKDRFPLLDVLKAWHVQS